MEKNLSSLFVICQSIWLLSTSGTGGEVENDALFHFECVHSEREDRLRHQDPEVSISRFILGFTHNTRHGVEADERPECCFSVWECYALRLWASSWRRDTQADETEGKKGTKMSFSDRACSSYERKTECCASFERAMSSIERKRA